MAQAKLSNTVTLRDVLPTLDNPEEYVRGVFHNMHEWRREKGDAYVAIGITGKGVFPHYSVTAGGYWSHKLDHSYGVFNGRTHKLTSHYSWGTEDVSWSGAFNGYEYVRDLLGELRTKRKGR